MLTLKQFWFIWFQKFHQTYQISPTISSKQPTIFPQMGKKRETRIHHAETRTKIGGKSAGNRKEKRRLSSQINCYKPKKELL